MTLKKCTVIELDINFWRVDFDGNLDLSRAASNYKCWSGPFCIQVVSARDGMFTAYASGIGTSVCGPTRSGALEAMLSHLGLTRHDPKPETAEERVRAAVDMSEPPLQADLRAILAELDRVRKDMGEISATLFASKVEVERLRSGMMPAAQRPVDIEAVLAPVRRVLSAYRTAPAYGMKYELLARHVVDDLGQALAEAEKIARGK